jgi:hypothetical protein
VGTTRIGDEDFLTLTFARRIDATGVVFTVEVADAPTGPWTPLDPFLPQNQVQAWPDLPQLGWQTLVIKDLVPITGNAGRFMRLNITRP